MLTYNIIYLDAPDEVKKSVEDFLLAWCNDDASISTFTSGSTGKPKSIKLLKSKMIESAMQTGEFLGLKEKQSALLCLSPETIAGKMMIVRAIALHLDLYVGAIDSHPFQNLDVEIDFVAMIPLQLNNSLDSNPEKLTRIKNIIIGGGIIPPTLITKLKNNKLTVFHTYGMTETISHIAMRKVGVIYEESYTALGETIFSELDGQLVIHSPILYSRSITTNDNVQIIDNKHFIYKGRADFVINSGGVKIHPEELENKLYTVISQPFFITSLPDEYFGEKVVLIIEYAGIIILSDLNLKEVLKPYEHPKEIYCIAQFVRTESGKINRLETTKKITGI